MKQYEYQATCKFRGNKVRIRATAKTPAIARRAITEYYSDSFEIDETPYNVFEPHQVVGEIDCSDSNE